MASLNAMLSSTTLLILFLGFLVPKIRADPDAMQDFCIADTSSPSILFMNGLTCISPTKATAKHFTSSILSTQGNISANPLGVSVILLTPDVLPGINTLGISMARIDLAAGVAPPHTHPRATEMVFIMRGKLVVGFVDSTNKLFSQVVKAGDVFVFPKGTLHYLQNIGRHPASMIAAFNSQNPGTFLVSFAVFASNPAIPDAVLAKGFQISLEEVGKIRKGLGGH